MHRRVFGDNLLEPFASQLVYQYVDKRSVKKVDPVTGKTTGGRIAAHREIELLSHAYTKAVQWGYISRHPFKNELRLEGERPRDRYVEDCESVEALSLDCKRKRGSDTDSLLHAQALLAHADSKTTKRVYRRKAEVVKLMK